VGLWAARCAGTMRAGVWRPVVGGRTPSDRLAAVRAPIAGQAKGVAVSRYRPARACRFRRAASPTAAKASSAREDGSGTSVT